MFWFLLIVGLLIGFGAYVYAARNMVRGVSNSTSLFSDFDSIFKQHVAAMIVMAFGGLLTIIGLIGLIADFLSRLVK